MFCTAVLCSVLQYCVLCCSTVFCAALHDYLYTVYSVFPIFPSEMTKGTAIQRSLAVLISVTFIIIITLLYGPDWKRSPVVLHQSAESNEMKSASSMNNTPSANATLTDRIAPSPMDDTPGPTATNVTVFVEHFDDLNAFYGNSFTRMENDIPRTCQLPHGGTCFLQHSNASALTSDVVFRMVIFIKPGDTVRYHEGQLLAILNSEAERDGYGYGLQQLREADIKIDHHPSSDVMQAEMCDLPVHKWETSPPADPAKRNGIAMFTSNCGAKWRSDYLEELLKFIPIDSYGHCWHNKNEPPGDRGSNLIKISSKYRMVVTFENLIQDDYITEKILLVFQSGAIPVYWGPPQIYSWVPGNHSFIDASKYSPENIAKYMKRVDEEDDLFRYHTSNFDVNKSKLGDD